MEKNSLREEAKGNFNPHRPKGGWSNYPVVFLSAAERSELSKTNKILLVPT